MTPKIIEDSDMIRLENAVRNLWMSSDQNSKSTYDRLCKWIDSLAPAAPSWQPIATAPHDGSPLIIYSRVHGYVVAWWDQVEGGGHPENGPPVYWWVSDHCEFIHGPHDAPLLWRLLDEPSEIVRDAMLAETVNK